MDTEAQGVDYSQRPQTAEQRIVHIENEFTVLLTKDSLVVMVNLRTGQSWYLTINYGSPQWNALYRPN